MKRVLLVLALLAAVIVPSQATAQERTDTSVVATVGSDAAFAAAVDSLPKSTIEAAPAAEAPATVDDTRMSEILLGVLMGLPFLIGMAGAVKTPSLGNPPQYGDELRQEFNKLVDDVEALRAAFVAHTHTENTNATYVQNATTGVPTAATITTVDVAADLLAGKVKAQ